MGLEQLVGVEGFEKDEYPNLARLMEKYNKLEEDEMREIADLVNAVDTYKTDMRKLIEGHEKLARKTTRMTPEYSWRNDPEKLDSDIGKWSTGVQASNSAEPAPEDVADSSESTEPPFRYFGRVTKTEWHNLSETGKILIELEVRMPFQAWKKPDVVIKGDEKFELIRLDREQ